MYSAYIDNAIPAINQDTEVNEGTRRNTMTTIETLVLMLGQVLYILRTLSTIINSCKTYSPRHPSITISTKSYSCAHGSFLSFSQDCHSGDHAIKDVP